MHNGVQTDGARSVWIPTCLMARVGDLRHVAACCSLLEQFRFVYDDATWKELPGMFRTLLRLGNMQLSLVEEREALNGSTISAFCASIFVADAFCCEARTAPTSPIWDCRWPDDSSRSALPVLDREQIALANSKAGVSVMTCYCGTRWDYLSSEPRARRCGRKWLRLFGLAHAGIPVSRSSSARRSGMRPFAGRSMQAFGFGAIISEFLSRCRIVRAAGSCRSGHRW